MIPEVALGLWALYGAAALGWRVAVQLRRTGRTGLIAARPDPRSLGSWVDAAQGLGIAAGLAAPILDLAGVLDPIGWLDRTGVQVAGIALFAVSLAGVVASQSAMGRSWRIGTDPGERTELVTNGPFALVRNPIYTALVPTLLGLALVVPSVVAFASVALFALATEAQVRRIEEPHLLRVHCDAYAAYAARVGRFLPRVGRL